KLILNTSQIFLGLACKNQVDDVSQLRTSLSELCSECRIPQFVSKTQLEFDKVRISRVSCVHTKVVSEVEVLSRWWWFYNGNRCNFLVLSCGSKRCYVVRNNCHDDQAHCAECNIDEYLDDFAKAGCGRASGVGGGGFGPPTFLIIHY